MPDPVLRCCCFSPVCEEADLALAVAAIVVAAQLCAVAAGVQPVLKQAAGREAGVGTAVAAAAAALS
jgi:hypothetical protein